MAESYKPNKPTEDLSDALGEVDKLNRTIDRRNGTSDGSGPNLMSSFVYLQRLGSMSPPGQYGKLADGASVIDALNAETQRQIAEQQRIIRDESSKD